MGYDTLQLLHGWKFRLGNSFACIRNALVRIPQVMLMLQEDGKIFEDGLPVDLRRLVDSEFELRLQLRVKVRATLAISQVGRKILACYDDSRIVVEASRTTADSLK